MQRQKRTLLDAAGSADPATFVQYICDNYKGEANALSELLQLFTTKEWHALWKGVHGSLAHIIEAGFVLPSSQPAAEADRGSLAQIPCDLGAAGDKEDDDGEEGITQDMAAATLEDSHLEEDEEDQQERRDAKLAALIGLQYMEAVVPLIEYFLQDSSHKNASPDMLLQILRLLHDNVFLQVHTMAEELGSIAPVEAEEVEGKAMMQQLLFGLSNSICNICEMWWKQERPDKEVLVPHTILFLLANALDEGGKAADVKRLYEFRASLLLLDFQDEESSLTLKRLLLQSAMHPLFLHTADGKKFLVYLFGLYPPFIDDLHATIKAQLFSSNKTMLKAYGEVYFKAWRSAEGAYKLKLEYDCIQDLMSNAIHLQNETLLGAIRRILSCFHQEKKQRGVDEMLLRLYEPILWRSLKVANTLVRRNAALLLFEAFPIQDPDSPAREVDEQLQKQFEVLAELMHDPAAEVRCVAAQGVCRILGVFWELIPLATTRALLGSLINELARDKSSSAVRAAVFEGLRFLLDNHLCHPTLKTLLPQLANLIHDNSERVRGAFLSLLCDIKQLRSIRFYEVVPLEQLLARLPLEAVSHPNGPLVKRLCQLLLSSYFPVERKPSVQVSCLF
ncbi:Condensin-2 complex subunit G2 [Balamuthia mandrillaris]